MPHQQHIQRNLSQLALLILFRLRQGPNHTVGLCEAIEQMEGLVIEPGTLYRALAHLEQRGWIEVTRLGMREAEMETIAEYIARILVAQAAPSEIGREVIEFRQA